MKADESRNCVECQGKMFPIVVMDKYDRGALKHAYAGSLEYRLADDQLNFWTGKYPTAGTVMAFMCEGCGRIALYGGKKDG